MTDISKCDGKDCPVKETCWRFKAPDNKYWQAYIDYKYIDGKCDGYWKIEKEND